MKTRAERRQKLQNVKKKIKRYAKTEQHRELSKKEIGELAQVHGAKCSCWACGNPRKTFKQKTIQEKRIDIDTKEQMN